MPYIHPLDQAMNQAAQLLAGNYFWRQVIIDGVAATLLHVRVMEKKKLEAFGECQEVAEKIVNQIFLRKREDKA